MLLAPAGAEQADTGQRFLFTRKPATYVSAQGKKSTTVRRHSLLLLSFLVTSLTERASFWGQMYRISSCCLCRPAWSCCAHCDSQKPSPAQLHVIPQSPALSRWQTGVCTETREPGPKSSRKLSHDGSGDRALTALVAKLPFPGSWLGPWSPEARGRKTILHLFMQVACRDELLSVLVPKFCLLPEGHSPVVGRTDSMGKGAISPPPRSQWTSRTQNVS